jgi:hypothetical protein
MHRLIGPLGALVGAALVLFAAAGGEAAPPPPPALAFAPSTYGAFDYGTVQPGESVSQEFTLSNSGGTASGALTIALSGSAAFTTTQDACSATSLGPGKSCTVTVEYAPTSAGQTDSATLTATGKKPTASTSLTLTGTGAVSGHVYWTNQGTNTIGRADLGGQNVNQSFISGASGPLGMAVDSGHVYWTNTSTNTIGRADLDGQNANQSFIIGASLPAGVAVGSG